MGCRVERTNTTPYPKNFDGDCSTPKERGSFTFSHIISLVNIKSKIPDVIMIGEPLMPTVSPELLLAAALVADSWIGEDVPLLDFPDELSDLAFTMDIVVFLSDNLFDKSLPTYMIGRGELNEIFLCFDAII